MTDLITSSEVLFDDIVGLLDFSAPLTPRAFADVSTDLTGAFATPVVSCNAASNSIDGVETDQRVYKREIEKTRQRRYRHRLKTLRDELQQQVDELTQKLHQLSEQKSKRKQLKTRQLTNSQWALEADRQHGHRISSEEENKRLLAAVHQQAEYIKGLQVVVGGLDGIPIRYSKTGALYMTYLQQLEGCYTRVDNIMDSYNMPSLQETTHNWIQRRQDGGEVSLYHHVTKVALPYAFDKTCEALWMVIHEQEEPAFGGYEIAPDDDVFIKSRVLNGLHAEETAWMIVRPTATGVMMEVCVQQVPMRFNISSNKEPEVAKFHNLLQESLEQDKKNMVTTLGELLLDDVLTGIEC
eukprot:jgi/Phyca11/554122/estExt2_Genewise1Plus.C_PHYCAscaffold_590102